MSCRRKWPRSVNAKPDARQRDKGARHYLNVAEMDRQNAVQLEQLSIPVLQSPFAYARLGV
jgi:hypothetical protein